MKNKSYVTKKVESIDTSELENILLSNKNETSKKIIDNNDEYFIDEDRNFSNYIKDMIKEKGMTIREVAYMAGYSESYGRKIISEEKVRYNRDVILKICIAAKLTVNETNRALKLHKMKSLYAKDKRDALIMIEINKGMRTIEDINDELRKNGLEEFNISDEEKDNS